MPALVPEKHFPYAISGQSQLSLLNASSVMQLVPGSYEAEAELRTLTLTLTNVLSGIHNIVQ
eukprot:scaffold293346_cov11-Tisochrysis_lutea.AAC.1